LAPDQLVAYKFDSNGTWTQRTFETNGHSTDQSNTDPTGVLGNALRHAYATAGGLSADASLTLQQTILLFASPTLARKVDAGATVQSATSGWKIAYALLGIAGTGLGAYHGYRRHRGSLGWG